MTDAILVLNAGSSSIKFSAFALKAGTLELLLRGQVEGLFTAPRFVARDGNGHEIGAKALTDTNYRRRLLDDPKSVLRKAGLEVADDVEVVIHRNRPNLIHLVLPAAPVQADQLDVDEVRVAMLHCHTF